MKRWITAGVLALALVGCSRYEPLEDISNAADGLYETEAGETAAMDDEAASPAEEEVISISTYPPREPVKVKGIYVSAYVAGTGDMMDKIIEEIDKTELNAVVIDVKDDQAESHFPWIPLL